MTFNIDIEVADPFAASDRGVRPQFRLSRDGVKWGPWQDLAGGPEYWYAIDQVSAMFVQCRVSVGGRWHKSRITYAGGGNGNGTPGSVGA